MNTRSFGLTEPIDLYHKLCWEYAEFQKSDKRSKHAQAYLAWNAAITAWHIADWMCARISTSQYQKLRDATGNKDLNNCKAFRKYVLAQPCMLMFEQIAVAGKHYAIDAREYEALTSQVQLSDDSGNVFWFPMMEAKGSKYPVAIGVGFAISFWRDTFIACGIATLAELENVPYRLP